MYTSFHLNANELNEEFLKKLKRIYKSKRISITVEEDLDETDYLLSTPANRKHLEDALKNVKAGKMTKVNIDKSLKR
jgi:antitoxin YefM